MNKPITKIIIACGLIAIAGLILIAQLGRGDGTTPTVKIEAGTDPAHRAPDEPHPGEGGHPDGLPEGLR